MVANPITIHHIGETVYHQYGIQECPTTCNNPIRGIPYDIVTNTDYRMSSQHIDFLHNHMQLVEMLADTPCSIRFSINIPAVFIVIMIEGFISFHRNNKVVSYAMAGVVYMTYSPQEELIFSVSAGKHALMVISLDQEWLTSIGQTHPRLGKLATCLEQRNEQTMVLPMCRLTPPIADLWDSMRIVYPSSFARQAELATIVAKLVGFYHGQLESGATVKGQLSAETANALFTYIEQNFVVENGISVERLAQKLDISRHKVEEYATFLFGKTLHKHIRDLRMAKAAQLLLATKLSVSDIAFSVGYANLPHFYGVFQKYFGTSPYSYKKNKTASR